MINFKELVNPEKIRSMIRDIPELNVLLNYEEQFSDEEIYDAAESAEEIVFAEFPALVTLPKIPSVSINYMVITMLLRSVSAEELRNQMQISDDNVGNIDLSTKSGQYTQLADLYSSHAKNIFKNIAAANYYQNMWGDFSSNSFNDWNM